MRKNNFKIVSLLTVFTIVLNVLSAVVMLQPAKAATFTDYSVTMTRQAVSATADYAFEWTGGTGTTVEITFPAGFNITSAASASATCTDTDQVLECTDAESPMTVTGIVNPSAANSYDLAMVMGDDSGTFNIVVVDSDQVNVEGYINTSLTFDLDTTPIDEDCDVDSCYAHSGAADTSDAYTVDLGNLTTAAVNASGDIDVMHSDGLPGTINYIWFDLSSNAAGGVIVTYVSELGYLSRHGLAGTPDAWDIPSVSDGDSITANNPGYGIKYAAAPTYENLGDAGTITQPSDCDNTDSTYCAMPTSATQILGVNTSVQELRAQLTVAAAVDGTMPAGTYVDQLTFIATGTF